MIYSTQYKKICTKYNNSNLHSNPAAHPSPDKTPSYPPPVHFHAASPRASVHSPENPTCPRRSEQARSPHTAGQSYSMLTDIRSKVTGKRGRVMQEDWEQQQQPNIYLSLAAPNFSNFFVIACPMGNWAQDLF
ncbi:hypothetical protein BDW62DRAFT_179414 [Aspergillus aurantiobrunneus]